VDSVEEIQGDGAEDREFETVQQSTSKTITVVVSAYCKENYPHICNDGESTYTATMTTPTAGRTIAVDPNIIPYGTKVEIEGIGIRIAEDCGGAIKGNRIDLYFDSHQEALEWGVQYKEVYLKNGE
jgi:3D (Asp-Asp-Asp) domain-containing protein